MPLDFRDLVKAATDKLGSENASELAEAIKLPGRGKSEDRARRWIQGRNAPDYYATYSSSAIVPLEEAGRQLLALAAGLQSPNGSSRQAG